MYVYTAPLCLPPLLGHGVIDIGLVYDFGDQLWAVLDERGIGSRYFGGMNSVGGAIFNEEGEEGEDGTEQEDDNNGVDDEEDGEAATHCGCGWARNCWGRSRRCPDR